MTVSVRVRGDLGRLDLGACTWLRWHGLRGDGISVGTLTPCIVGHAMESLLRKPGFW